MSLMKNVLYIGNALSSKGKNKSVIETLSACLKEIYTVKIASKKSNKILRLLDMMRLVLVNRSTTDLVLIDTYSTINFYYALVISQLCRFFKIRYIPILHGGNLENRLKHNPKLSSVIFNNAYKLVAPSHFLKNVFESYGYSNVFYIPNCIEIKNYEFRNRYIDTIRLLWVRSFSAIYNPELAIFILESLLTQGYKTELTMVGPEVDGSMAKVKSLAINKNLKIDFTGKLPKPEWIERSKSHNIFINTTNYDNMPVSVIEAMALGIPVVSTNVGGLPFLISDNEDGLLVSPNNVDAMVNAIIKLKNNPTLKDEIVSKARKKVEQFDWEVIKPKWEACLT